MKELVGGDGMKLIAESKKTLSILLVAILFVTANQIPGVQHVTARIATNVYINFKYEHLKLSYDSVEYSPQLGDYSVAYKDGDGKRYGFMVTPKAMPIFIRHDPLEPAPE